MLTKMPDWKFLLVWMIGAMFGAGYLIKAIAELIK